MRLGALSMMILLGGSPPTPIGTWKGKILLKASQSTEASYKKAQRQLGAATTTLVLRADHTFLLTIVGLPSPTPATLGSWSQKEGFVTILSRKKGARPQKLTFDPSGKRLILPEPGGGKVVFTR